VESNVPPAFNPIVLRCLEKDPARRFATAGQLAEALTALLRLRGHELPPEPGGTQVGTVSGREEPERERWSLERLRRWWEELPLPPVLRREVTGRWAAGIVLGWVALWTVTGLVLAGRVDRGPFEAPVQSRIRAIHRLGVTLRRAGAALESGDPETALARAREVLDQAPASPAARRIAAAASELAFRQRQSEATRKRVEELIAQGRELFHRKRYRSAAARFEGALELDPENDLAESFLELARARSGQGAGRASPRSTPSRRRGGGAAPASRPARPATAQLTLSFDSPINAGTVLITMDGKTLANVPFDFTRKGFLGFKRRGTGRVRKSLTIPAGQHTLGVQLSDERRGPRGFASFTRRFEGDSNWTLRIDLASRKAEPAFYLVRAAQ
jgi:tetratricopeptide (TPR) repeat protein